MRVGRDLVINALKPLALSAEAKGLELINDVGLGVPAGVLGDPFRLRQVLSNLVANAIKFTERGHVLVQVRAEPSAEGMTRLHFAVTDTGIGIPPEKQASIFEAFVQADGSTTRRFGGTGLGLTISATLIRLMGGRIWVESAVDGGSTFQFVVDLLVTEPLLVEHAHPLLVGLPVLVVDDNPVNRRIFVEQLSRWQMKPVAVDHGRAALEALDTAAARGTAFVLALLDANMPGLDGFELAEEIRRRPALAGIRLMMLTSSGRSGNGARRRAPGIDSYLTKPVRQVDLFEAIASLMQPRPEAKQGHAPVTSAEVLAAPAVPAVSSAQVLVAEDNVVNQRVVARLLTSRGHVVTIASNGIEAVAAFRAGRFDVVLMDVQMPEMGGFEATAAIRELEQARGGRVRIIALTAHAMSSDRQRCLAAGMDGYMSKPIDRLLLFEAVEAVPGPAQDTDDVEGAASDAPIDRQALMERLGDDEELAQEIIELFRQDSPDQLAQIRTAIAAGDAGVLRSVAHALKGAAGNLSAGAVAGAARELELMAQAGDLSGAPEAQLRLERAVARVLVGSESV